MLFNSYIFIFAFLPIVFFGFFLIGKHCHALASIWLAVSSLFFYGWWDVRYVALLLGSIAFNYSTGYLIGYRLSLSLSKPIILLAGSIAVNLSLLGYFKYANFFAENLNYLAGTSLPIGEVFLPLGISFFTFTQIAFLVDTYQGKVNESNFAHYTLFVTYFPHLLAGPVLHHKEMMPQFAQPNVCHLNWDNIASGLAIFVLGLAKKILIADSLAEFSTPIFNSVAGGGKPMLFEAWIGALGYSLQLYFDFSAYSDMAIGLSLIFNVRMPMNFNSPYKATSIIDFWQRWHMTLSRFLRDYLYIPMGGNRKGKTFRFFNLMVTMLLGGLWHGAGWTFVIWGGLHGFYLIMNHAWRGFKQRMGWKNGGRLSLFAANILTFSLVVVGWVIFRADSLSSATTMLQGMAGINGVSLPPFLDGKFWQFFVPQNWLLFSGMLPLTKMSAVNPLVTLTLGFIIIWIFPNIRQMFHLYRPVCEDIGESQQMRIKRSLIDISGTFFHRLQWRATQSQGICFGIFFFVLTIYMATVGNSEFLYFKF